MNNKEDNTLFNIGYLVDYTYIDYSENKRDGIIDNTLSCSEFFETYKECKNAVVSFLYPFLINDEEELYTMFPSPISSGYTIIIDDYNSKEIIGFWIVSIHKEYQSDCDLFQ